MENDPLLIGFVAPFALTGFLFTGDVVGAMEKYSNDLVHSVMGRAEAIYRDFGTNVIITPTLLLGYQ